MFYTHYRGRSVGRLIGLLECYCGLRWADDALYGDGKVTRHGKLFATYTWPQDEASDLAEFKFPEDKEGFFAWNQFALRPFCSHEVRIGPGNPTIAADVLTNGNFFYVIQEAAKLTPIFEAAVQALIEKHIHYGQDTPGLLEHIVKCAKLKQEHLKYEEEKFEREGKYRGDDDNILARLVEKYEAAEKAAIPAPPSNTLVFNWHETNVGVNIQVAYPAGRKEDTFFGVGCFRGYVHFPDHVLHPNRGHSEDEPYKWAANDLGSRAHDTFVHGTASSLEEGKRLVEEEIRRMCNIAPN